MNYNLKKVETKQRANSKQAEPKLAETKGETKPADPPKADVEGGNPDAKSTAKSNEKSNASKATPGRVYSDVDMQELLVGYFNIPRDMWDHIPSGAHLRYMKKNKPGENKPKGELFKPGGFVRTHFANDAGVKMIMIETIPGGKKTNGNITFPLTYDNIESIWKKYDHGSFIEWHMNTMSLIHKKKQIEDLERTCAALSSRVKSLEDMLIRAVKK